MLSAALPAPSAIRGMVAAPAIPAAAVTVSANAPALPHDAPASSIGTTKSQRENRDCGKNGNTARLISLTRLIEAAARSPEKISSRGSHLISTDAPANIPANIPAKNRQRFRQLRQHVRPPFRPQFGHTSGHLSATSRASRPLQCGEGGWGVRRFRVRRRIAADRGEAHHTLATDFTCTIGLRFSRYTCLIHRCCGTILRVPPPFLTCDGHMVLPLRARHAPTVERSLSMRQALLALLLIPILAGAALFGGRLSSTTSSQTIAARPMVPCSGISSPC